MSDSSDNPHEDSKINSSELIDGEGNCLAPTPVKIDLHDAHAVRRELASVYRDMRLNRIESQDGTRLAYVLDMIRKAYETGVLQCRIESLEQTLSIRKADHES